MFRKDDIKNILRSILRPAYYFLKDLSPHTNRLMARNSTLKNKYAGKRGFLLLSGESLNWIEISKLKGEYTIGCGFMFLDKNIVNLPLGFTFATEAGPAMDKLNAYGSCNWPEEYLPSHGRNQGYIYLKQTKEQFTDKGTITFLDADKITYYKRIKLFNFNEPNVIYIKSTPYLFTTKAPKLDLTQRFAGGDGGIFNSILIMIYMGFKDIYLAGAGYTYDPVYELHFYDNLVFSKSMGKGKVEIEARKAIDVRNKNGGSTLEYYGLYEKGQFYRGIYISRSGYDPYWDKHRILNNYARSQGVKIFNIVPDGFESPVYEKISWKDVEGKIRSGNPNKGKFQ